MDVGYAHTTSLVEIFQISIDKFDEMERRGEVYGKIGVVDLNVAHTLYQRDRGNSEHVRANSTLSLTGPSQTISVITGFCVTIDLHLGGTWGIRSCGSSLEDVALGNWQLSWDYTETEVARITCGRFFQDYCDRDDLLSIDTNVKYQSAGYDKPLCASFEGPNGHCITMYYAIFQHAVQAWVQVEVVDMNGVPTIADYDVCGSITASYSHFEFDNDCNFTDHCKTTLLKTKDLEKMNVERGKKIQLSRCFIAVPIYASLVIEADLWSSSLKIAKGKVEFTPNHFEIGYDYIRGDGDIGLRVMICWSYGSSIPRNNPFD